MLLLLGIVLQIMVIGAIAWYAGPSDSPIIAPGETLINVTKPGQYTIWEQSAPLDGVAGVVDLDQEWPEGSSFIISDHNGALIDVGNYMAESYTSFQIKFRETSMSPSLRVFFAHPGEYRISVKGLPEQRTFHLKPAHPSWFFAAVGIVGGVGVVSLVLAAIFALFAVVKLFIQSPKNSTLV